jgi:hypothetical protein
MLSALKRRVKQNAVAKRLALCAIRCAGPWLRARLWRMLTGYSTFFRDVAAFRAAGGIAPTLDFYRCLFDRTANSGIDVHYFHQAIRAFRHLTESAAASRLARVPALKLPDPGIHRFVLRRRP